MSQTKTQKKDPSHVYIFTGETPEQHNKCKMNVLINIVSDFILWLIIGSIALGLELVASPSTPYQRGFYCDDSSIRYPYRNDTISTALLTGVGLAIPITTIFIVEWLLYAKFVSTAKPLYNRISVGKYSFHPYAVALYSTIGPMMFGLVVTFLLTNCSKYLIGRLRPHFIDVCQPDWSRINCTDAEGYPLYVLGDFCTGDQPKLRTDARLSFPSGHSSIAFYLLIFWAIYLQKRFIFSPITLLRPFLQVVGISMAVFCAETRVSDYKHHASDVIAGGLLGTIIVLLTVAYLSDLYSRQPTPIPSGSEIHDKTPPMTNGPKENGKGSYGSTSDYNTQMSTVTVISEAP